MWCDIGGQSDATTVADHGGAQILPSALMQQLQDLVIERVSLALESRPA